MIYLIANWKQNKKINELELWVEEYLKGISALEVVDDFQTVLCPPSSFLFEADRIISASISPTIISLGAQNVSAYLDGPHTGEVGLEQMPEKLEYALIGHSERRKDGEDFTKVNQKIDLVLQAGIIPIVCFSNIEEFKSIDNLLIQNGKILFAYEPIESIGTGNPASLQSISQILSLTGLKQIIYGGSVDPTNISDYLGNNFINGFLVGGASLDPSKFSELTKIVSAYINK